MMRIKLLVQLLLITVFAAGIFIAGCASSAANNSKLAAATPAASAPGTSPSAVPTLSPSPAVADNAERISLADAKKEFDAGNAVFIDVRGAEVYKIEHIKGALNILSSDIAANINKIPKGKKIIAYCS